MPQVINLWHIVFGDSSDFVRSLFDHFPIHQIGWGLFPSHDHLAAIAFTLPLDLPDQTAYYLYACATSPQQQGQGYQSALLHHLIQAHRHAQTDLLLTLPASQSLFHFYARFGFRNVSFVRETLPTPLLPLPIHSSLYLDQRLNHPLYPSVESKAYLHWSIGEMQKEGFHTYQTTLPDRTLYTLSRTTDSGTLVADCFTRFQSDTPEGNELQFTSVPGMALELSDCIPQTNYYFAFLQNE